VRVELRPGDGIAGASSNWYGTSPNAVKTQNWIAVTVHLMAGPCAATTNTWKIKRLFAWLHNFRRLVIRWEYHAQNFLGFLHPCCAHILLRHL